jgi:uncharacterized membrane protein YgcG
MASFLVGLLFLSGMPIAMFVLPISWWPWSVIGWFMGFVLLHTAIRAVARRWRGQPLPAGPVGLAIGLAIVISGDDDGGSGGDGDGGDGGGDGGGGD